jgi:acetyltransferase-like isoleucine patch superfamily enzyme
MEKYRENIKYGLEMPWIISYEFRRIMAWPYIRFLFALQGIEWGKNWRIWGMPMIQRCRDSKIILGDGIQLRSWGSTNPLSPNHPVTFSTRSKGACILIGRDVGMTGATIVAMEKIEIGDRVLIGSNSTVLDTDFHPLVPSLRQTDILAGEHSPILIEDDVFIGMNTIILKGTRIGEGTVIGAGSVVSGEFPPGVVVAGNPARIIGEINQPETFANVKKQQKP